VTPGTQWEKKNSSTTPQAAAPIRYPAIPPTTEAPVVRAANQYARSGRPRQSARRSGSGGTGKNEDSANERTPSARGPWGVVEIPIGVVTALVGVPFFLVLLRRGTAA